MAPTAFDPATENVVLFGGAAGAEPTAATVADTWTWNGTTWTEQFPATSPPAREGASMADDPATGNVVLFGGNGAWGGIAYLADTWTWDGTTWTKQFPATSPPAREGGSIAYDPADLGNMVLFGGYDNSSGWLGDTWTWNGTTWTEQFPATSPLAREGASMAYDPATGTMSSSAAKGISPATQVTLGLGTAPRGASRSRLLRACSLAIARRWTTTQRPETWFSSADTAQTAGVTVQVGIDSVDEPAAVRGEKA